MSSEITSFPSSLLWITSWELVSIENQPCLAAVAQRSPGVSGRRWPGLQPSMRAICVLFRLWLLCFGQTGRVSHSVQTAQADGFKWKLQRVPPKQCHVRHLEEDPATCQCSCWLLSPTSELTLVWFRGQSDAGIKWTSNARLWISLAEGCGRSCSDHLRAGHWIEAVMCLSERSTVQSLPKLRTGLSAGHRIVLPST